MTKGDDARDRLTENKVVERIRRNFKVSPVCRAPHEDLGTLVSEPSEQSGT